MKFEITKVFNLEGALRGMRNPMNSHNKSDSCWISKHDVLELEFNIGNNDLVLAQKLVLAGSEHRKFMRQIFVCVDITAPLYWWKEFDTYKIGTVSNSESTMHKIHSKPITLDCFEPDREDDGFLNQDIDDIIILLENLRKKYIETKNKKYWYKLIKWLPSAWLQKRTITMSYENILSMVNQRNNHKLTEWSVDFINWAKSLPYSKELIFIK